MGTIILWALAIATCFHVYRQVQKHFPVEQDGGYSKTALPNGLYKFTVKPNTVPKIRMSGGGLLPVMVFLFCALIFGSMAIGVAGNDRPSLGSLFFVGALFAVYPTYLVSFFVKGLAQKNTQKNIGRETTEFTLDEKSISSNGKTFLGSDIARLVIRNIIDQADVPSSGAGFVPVVNVGTLAGGTAALAAGITSDAIQGQKNAAREIANALYVEAGGNRHLLGSGLNEVQAFGLLKEVSDIMGFRTRTY